MKRLILTLVLLIFFNAFCFAQGSGAMPVMTMQTSLPLLGAGEIGVAKANNDPIGYYLNPAVLGYTSQNNHFSLFFMTSKVDWIPSSNYDLTKNTFGFNLGYNFSEFGLPISVGFGYMHDKFEYSTFTLTGPYSPDIIGKFTPYDSFDAYSFGVGFDYYVLFNLGISIKPFDSFLVDEPNIIGYGTTEWRSKGTAYDYGVMLVAPISKLFFEDIKYKFCEKAYIKPNVNFTLGYAITNVGDEISYVDDFQKDPLSRTGRLGYTFDFGFDAYINNTQINLFTYSFTAEVEDLLLNEKVLITEYDHGGRSFYYHIDGYQSLLGDIDIWDNLLLLNPSDKVVVHKGHTLNLFETLTITSGSFVGNRYPQTVETSGYGLSSEGILKIVGNLTDNLLLKYFAKHFILEYYDVSILRDYNFKTDMQGISLHMKNIEL